MPAEITEDTLRFYFENKRSGGKNDGVEECELFENLKLGKVTFTERNLVESVMKVANHTPVKVKPPVTVEPYYAEFHDDVLRLAELELCNSPAKEEERRIIEAGETPPPYLEEAARGDGPRTELLSHVNVQEKVQLLQHQVLQDTSPISAEGQMLSLTGKSRDRFANSTRQERNENFNMISLNPHTNTVPVPVEDPYERIDDHALFQPSKVSHVLPVAEQERCVEQFQSKAPPPLPPKPQVESPRVTILQTSVQFPSPNVRLLESCRGVDKEFSMCKITYNIGSGRIDVEGPENKLQELQLRLYEENQKICSSSHHLLQTIADVMNTEKGKSFVDRELKGQGNSLWYIDGKTVHCVSFSESESMDMITSLKKLIVDECIKYNESHYTYLNSGEWKVMKKSKEDELLVKVVEERKKHEIKIHGLNGDADVCKRELLKELKSHSNVSKMFSVSGTKARCMKNCFSQNLAEIKKNISCICEDLGDVNSLKLRLTGSPEAVRSMEDALNKLEKKVWHERLDLSKDVAKEKDINLLVRGMQRSDLRAQQAAFEAKHPVFLELNIPGVKKPVSFAVQEEPPASSRRDEGMFARSRSLENLSSSLEDIVGSDGEPEELPIFPGFSSRRAAEPRRAFQDYSPRPPMKTSTKFGNITVAINKGDITKEKADVLVNVVPPNLDLTATAISQAFKKAGGPTFVQQYEMAKSGWSQGGIIQTKCCGNLQGKMVYTISVDKWNPPRSKTDLKALIVQCLNTAGASGFSSIAMSSVGCGKLFHFPTKFVASCLINAVKANSGIPNLTHVSMVIYDHSSYQTFLDEINPRPAARYPMMHSRSMATLDDYGQSGMTTDSATVGSTKITVEQGDITKSKAKVLVNVITSDLDLGSTAVSQAFARAGGEELLEEFEAKKGSPSRNNIIVTSGGRLRCQYVYHVVLDKWNAGASKTVYAKLVNDCFQLAGGYNTHSIAFPSLGCGVLFKYPSDFVAECLLSEAKSSSLSNVTFVIYDRPVLNVFLQELRGISDVDVDEDEAEKQAVGTLRQYVKASEKDRKPSSDNRKANIVIYGADKSTCMSAKGALSKQLAKEFLHSEVIKNEKYNLTRLHKKTYDALKSEADRNGIWIKFPNPDKKKKGQPEIKLKGDEKTVLLVKSKIQDILTNAIPKAAPARQMRPARGSRGSNQFLLDMAQNSDYYPPPYWTHFKPKNPLKEFATGVKEFFTGSKPPPKFHLVTVDPKTFNAVDSLVQKTWMQHLVGHGQDAVGLHHTKLAVKEVKRLENPEMFTRYCQKRSTRFMEACKARSPLTPIDKLYGSKGPPLTTQFAPAELQVDVYHEVNEHYFFHGTKPDMLQAILEHGLDSRVGNTQAMFGSGVYGAESSTKADQYTDDKKHRTVGQKQMVLMRMTLGLPYVCSNTNAPKYRRPPCRDMNHLDEKCTKNHDFFHSVLGDGHWNFREFVVYEPDLCYPEYVITYDRV